MSDILVHTEAGVMTLTFNRLARKNSITSAMYGTLADALAQAAEDPAVRCVLLQGDATIFSAGNDIGDFQNAPPRDAKHAQDSPVYRFLRGIAGFPKPIVAAVCGPAVGIGTTMLLHCDLVYATPAASLRTPFLDLGLIQEAGSSITAPARMGYPRAFEMICLGEPFSAERALQSGLVNAIVPADQLEATAMKAAKRLAAKPRQALMTSRRLLRKNHEQLSAMIEEEAQAYKSLMTSPEAREAFTAFLEKRAPDFAKARKGG